MRVTIAASGQGRFQEELDFAEDCYSSGYKPMLLVLDPTPSTKYSDLKKQFERHGGQALSGEEAWQHIASKSGEVMSTFIAKYVKKPLEVVEANDELESLTIKPEDGNFSIFIGDTEIIKRAQLQSDSDSVEI